jgi:hypothetical protein
LNHFTVPSGIGVAFLFCSPRFHCLAGDQKGTGKDAQPA